MSISSGTAQAGEAHSSAGGTPFELRLTGISKAYGVIQALDDVSMDFRSGEVHALCGHNGAGKSTLTKILTGIVRPDTGEIKLDGDSARFHSALDAQRAGLAIVDQELGLVPSLTVAENLVLGNVDEPLFRRPRRSAGRARDLLARVGLDRIHLHAPLSSLEPGERKLVEIAHALGRNARFVILDEPTSCLSRAEAEMVFASIRAIVAEGAGVAFVSHRLGEVFELCHRITVLRDGRVVGSRPAAEFDRSTLIYLMLGDAGKELAVDAQRGTPGPRVRMSNLTVPPLVRQVELEVPPGLIVGLAGQVGSGSSDILRGVAGLVPGTRGELELGGKRIRLGPASRMARRHVHYCSNDRKEEGLFLAQSLESNLTATRLATLTRGGILRPRLRRRAARRLVDVLGVESHGLDKPVGRLSGGNQQKVLIGRALERGGGELLLLDDPTRGVDVAGRAGIHRLIRLAAAAGNAVVFVSTELDELLELSDIVVTVFDGAVVSTRTGDDVNAAALLREMTGVSEGTMHDSR